MILKTFIVCEEKQTDFQRGFDEIVEKLNVLGTRAEVTQEWRDGKFVAFFLYHVPQGQSDFDMSMPVETLRALERVRMEDVERRRHAADDAAIQEIRKSHEKNTTSGKGTTIWIEPALTGVGRRYPTGMGRHWERFVSFLEGLSLLRSS